MGSNLSLTNLYELRLTSHCKLAFRNIFVNKIVILCCVNLKLRKIFLLFLNSCFRWPELLALLGIKVVVHIEYQSLAQET